MAAESSPASSSTSISKRRVVFLIQNFFPSIGGAERQALELARTLIKNNLADVTILTRCSKGSPCSENISGVPVRRLGCGSFLFMVRSFLWLLTHAGDYDVIHAHLASSHAIGGALAGKLLGKKVVVKLSGSKVVGEIPVSKKSLLGRLKLRLLSMLNPVLVMVSAAQAEDLNGFGLEKLEKHLIPNGVDTAEFHSASAGERAALRQNLKWDGTVYLFVGRFEPDKLRLDVFENFMKAWAASVKDGKKFLYLVGKGSLESAYQKVIAGLNLQSSVFIWPAREKVVDLYQAADIFVLPSVTEGLSNAMLEAMASGLPVLGSRVDGIKDFVEEGANGVLFDPLSVGDMESALRKISPAMGKQSRKVAENYSIELTAQKIAEIYRS